jgi:hypothetical protein
MRFTLSASWFNSRDSWRDTPTQIARRNRLGGGGRLA